MKKRMFVLVIIITSVFFLLSGCDKVGITTGTVPVYRGMTVLNDVNTTTSFYQQETDDPETDPLDDPETDPIDEIFQDDIEDAFGIITSEEVEYYVLPNTTLYIHITVYNPDQFEILSFSMNGKKYQSYEFEDGSNSELLILEVTIDETPGIREFTLDGIKYIDGTTINDVLMDGNQTVTVGVEHTNLPFSLTENLSVGSTSFNLDAKVTDYADLILEAGQSSKFFIYDGLSIVYEQDLGFDVTHIDVNQLTYNKTYSYAIAAAYDKVDGQGVGIHVLETGEFSTLPLYIIHTQDIDQTSINIQIEDLDLKDVATITSIELFDGLTLLETSLTIDQALFTDLYSGHDYQIKVNYQYDLGEGIQTDFLTYDAQTIAKTLPTLNYLDLSQTQTSLEFDFEVVDEDQIATILSLDIYLEGVLIESKTLEDTFAFDDLLSNTDYEIRLNYTYDMNDGNGVQTAYISSILKTMEKTTPTLDITTYETSYDQIEFDYVIDDIDTVGYMKTINLYEEGTLVRSLTDLTLKTITDVIADTLYNLEIIYAYDLNDGIGEQELVVTKEGFTKPYLSVISTEIINTERLTEGDTIRMEVEVDNPSSIEFSHVIINGDTYPISNVSTQHSIYLEFIVDDSFTGGETAFVVEQIIGTKHGVERIFDTTENNTGYAFINGDITIKSIMIIDQYDNPIDKVMPGDIFYVKVIFDNPTGYDITNLKMANYNWDEGNNVNFTLSDDKTTAVFEQTAYYRNQILNFHVKSFTYGDDTFGFKTKDVDGVSTFIVSVTSSVYTYIYTADDLKNMKDGYAYKLANDIDLDGITWEPKDIAYVVLDGNGYAIKNLSIVKTYTDTDVHLGLFKNINYSTITNLTLENFLFLVDMQRDQTSNNFSSYAGFLSSNSYMSSFSKINVYGELSIQSGLGYDNQTGGLLGRSDNVSIDQIYVNANISSNVNRIGGIVGNAYETTIAKSYTEGKIFGKNETAGLIGYAQNSKITNSYSNATITVEENGAGLVGSANGIYILDSYYEGVISMANNWGNNGAGIITWGDQITLINVFSIAFDQDGTALNAILGTWGEHTFENVYAHPNNFDQEGILEASYEAIFANFNDIWDLNIWAFTDEKIVLKWTPSIRFTNIIESENFIGFAYATTDFDMVGQIESISLYKGDELFETITDLNIDRFEGLRHNTSYILVIRYVYNYGDELGDQVIEVKKEVRTTPAEGTPEITNLVYGVTHDTINFSYDLTDPNSIGVFDSIKLYDENQALVQELAELDDLEFTGLLSNHMYKLVIKYGYTLDEIYGVEYNTKEVIIRTNPYVSFNSTIVLNTDALFMGDTLVIEVDIDNPDEIEFTEAVINGVTYPVINSSVSRLRVDMLLDNSYINGENTITIEKLIGLFNSEIFEYTLEDNNTDDIYMNGNIDVIDMNIYALNGSSVEYISQNNMLSIEIILDNNTLYDINSIELQLYRRNWGQYSQTITDFTIDDEKSTITFTLNADERLYQISVYSIEYSSERLSSITKVVSDIEESILVVEQETINYIYTPDDLQNIESGKVYQLANDIDLSGFSFTPIENFFGYLDGNGHVISNLTLIKSYTDENVRVGLFEALEFAIIKNLVISDSNIVITHRSTNSDYYESYIGVLAGYIGQQSMISNIVISANLDVNQENFNGNARAGLLAGYIDQSKLREIRVSGTITGEDNMGGIAGNINNSDVRNSYANVDLNVTGRYTGNFAGEIYGSTIINSYATGINSNTTSYETGGFATFINNSVLKDVLSFTKDKDGAYKNPVLHFWDSRAEGTFSPAYNELFVTATIENMILHAQENWDSNIWTFTKELPMIKRIPTMDLKVDIKTISSLSFNIEVLDFDEVGSIQSVALYLKGVLIEELTDFTDIKFENLRYSSRYELRVVYAYDYEDGLGEQIIQKSLYAYTSDKENVPSVDYRDVVIDQDSIIFDYDLTDPLDIATFDSISLYDENNNLVDTIYATPYVFSNLYSNSYYYILVNYTYEFTDDTWGENLLEAIYEFETESYDIPSVQIQQGSNEIDSITFVVESDDPNTLGFVSKIELYDNNSLIQTLETFNDITFTNLSSDHWYRVILTYTYDLNDQQGPKTLQVESNGYTSYVQTPYYWVNDYTTTINSITLDYDFSDEADISTLVAIDLYDGFTKVDSALDLDNVSFSDLLSNHQYSIRFVYEYDKNNGQGIVRNFNQFQFSTLSYFIPEVDFTSIEVTQNEMFYEGTLIDENNLGQITHMAVYLDDVLVSETNLDTISLDSLTENTEYVLIVSYTYNLLDGKGEIAKEVSYTFETAPYADITSVSLLNNNAIAVGDPLSISIEVDNPNQIVITHVVINGIKYEVSSFAVTRLRVDLTITEALGQYETTLTVEKLIGTYEGKYYTYYLTESNTVDTYINGNIYIESIDFLDMDLNEIEFIEENQMMTVRVNMYNPTNYQIDQLNLYRYSQYGSSNETITDFIIDSTSYLFTIAVTQGEYFTINFEQLVYSNENIIERTKALSFTKTIIVLQDDEVREIKTAEDLLNVESGYHYVLMNDIDLYETMWVPIEKFSGVFDGNGHVISNLTLIESFIDENAYAGLFEELENAVVKNVIMNNATIVVTQGSTNGNYYEGFIGILAGRVYQNTQISNIIISGEIDTVVTSNGSQFTGFIAGHMDRATLSEIRVEGIITAGRNSGGIAGRIYQSYIQNVYSYINLYVDDEETGNFAGSIDNSTIINSYATGIYSNYVSPWQGGGFAGYVYSSTLENVLSFTKDHNGEYKNPVSGYWNNIYTNVYGLTNYGMFTKASYEEMMAFAQSNWDNSIWIFTKEFPTLKRIPILNVEVKDATISTLSFDINIMDLDNVGEIKSAALYLKGVLVEELIDYTTIEFENLRYSTKYELRIVYGYDYQDGLGEQLIETSMFAFTDDKDNVPSIEFKDVVIDQESITLDYDLIDPLLISDFVSVELYDEDGILLDTLTAAPYTFDGLYADTLYYVQVNYTYEFTDDTWGENTLEAIYEFVTDSYDVPTVSFGSSDNGVDYIDFSLIIDDDFNLGVISAVELYKDGTKVDELETFDTYKFEDLLSNNWYTIKVTYTYDLNDQQGLRTFIVESSYNTQYISNPYYYMNELNTNFDSVKFTYYEEDPNDISTLISIDLYNGLTKIDSLDTFEVISFNDLLSNHQYYVRFVYEYDKNDGNGLVTSYRQDSFVTSVYETPVVDFSNIEVTTTALSYEALLQDGYNLGQITQMDLYLDGVLIEQTTNDMIQAIDLLQNTTYQLLVSYEYNLADGKGLIQKQASYTFETAPYADIAGVSIINNTAVAVGDSLSINIDLDNPNEIVFEEVVINGIKYEVSSYTVSKLRVDILLTEEIGQLATTLTVEKLIGTFNDKLYTYNVNHLNTVDTYINGDIYIESIEILNSSQEVVTYGILNETVTVKINFYNPSNYNISNIEIYKTNYNWGSGYNIDDFTVEGDSYIFTTVIEWDNILTLGIENFTYENSEIEERTKQSNFEKNLIILQDLEVRNIYTAEDLQDMISGYHYVLRNDIDLSSSLWTPIEDFKGVFDGNSYTISNLTFIKTYLDQEVYAGLFSTISYSEIRNVTLENVSIITTLRTNNNTNYQMSVGGLAGRIDRSILENINISGQIDLKNETYQYGNYTGFIAGTINDSTLNFIYVNGYVKSTGEVSGISSRFDRSDATNIIANVSLRSENNYLTSGLFNEFYNSSLVNGYAIGRSYSTEYYYNNGLTYHANNSTIENSFSYLYGPNNRILRSVGNQSNSKFTNVYTPVNDGYTTVMPLADVLDLMNGIWGNEYFVYVNDYPLFKIEPKLEVRNVVSDNSTITFDLYVDDPHQIGEIDTILLYQDQVLIAEITDLENLIFTDLRYGSTYKIEVTYIYDYQDGTGQKQIVATYRVRTTDPEDVPEITIINVAVGQEDITFDYQLVDELGITQSMVYNLLDQDYNILQTSLTLKSFSNLYSETTYFLEVIAIYEFADDEFGPSQASEILEFTTYAKAVPTMSFNNVSSTNNSISFNFNLSDIDEVGAFTEISIYQGSTLIESLSDLTLRTFNSLDAYTEYTIYAVYTYNLNQGLADVVITDDYTVKTTPVVELTETRLMNTSAIVSGDAISLKLYLNNPNGLEFTDVMINGQVYSVTQLSQTELLVEFLTDENYIGGLTDLVVTNLYATYENQAFNITTAINNTAQIMINGDIYVESIDSYLNQEVIYYTYINQEIEVVVQFYNPTGYDIDSITIYRGAYGNTTYDSTQFTLNEDHTQATIDFTASNTNMYENLRVDSFYYSNEALDSRSRLSAADPNHIVLMTTEVQIVITTAEELQNMSNDHSYILANDIDLDGFEWEPIVNFKGSFDGAGFTISNLNIVKTYEDQTPYVGLFASTSLAIIKNITLENVNISITTRTYIDNNYEMYVGALIGRTNAYTVIKNVSVTGTITATNTTDSSTYIGGLAGSIEESVIENININAFITSNSTSWGGTGGVAGQFNSSKAQRIYVNVVIDAYRYVGGVFGRMYSSSLNIAEAHVDINAYEYVGGLVSSVNNSDISNVYTTGTINITNWGAGGILFNLRDNSTLTYSYSTINFNNQNSVYGLVREVSNSEIRFVYTTSKSLNYDDYVRAIEYVNDSYEFEDVYTLYQYTDYATYSNNLASIQQIMSTLFDHSIWDFETLDEQGNPTLQ